jgi:hypothetical protein
MALGGQRWASLRIPKMPERVVHSCRMTEEVLEDDAQLCDGFTVLGEIADLGIDTQSGAT